MGTLYLVATPIGNLEDITLRALRVLKEVTLVAAEDTRTARNLLTHFQISKPITSYYEHNKLDKLGAILDALASGDVAVISEAGMPGLSDPGYELVRAALEQNIRVVPIPGPSALTTALVASGLPTDQFVYLGFLPRQKSARRKLLQSVAEEPRTLVAYEAPHRVRDALDDIAETLGDRLMCAARELTKMYEEFFRGSVNAAREHFAEHEPRGEFTLVIAGADPKGLRLLRSRGNPSGLVWNDAQVLEAVRDLIASGLSRTDAVKRVARSSGRDRHAVYQLTMNQ
ncbi:MAG: 16S rRNA (cytidine(1402)-2'-O)-methyltransferase [Chloroflexi bacterium RBG_16_56_8]|nr:MAG: 16S rRNA (cytidine(1402)-2'-O)-methyltransferase [Chloroflexi bacterium RBG_16_56_8]